MEWGGELEKLVYVGVVLGVGFGIMFLVLGDFANTLPTNSMALNATNAVINAFYTPIKTYLGLIVTIIFLIIVLIIALKGIHSAKIGKR